MKRKILALLLCFAMLFSLMPTMALAVAPSQPANVQVDESNQKVTWDAVSEATEYLVGLYQVDATASSGRITMGYTRVSTAYVEWSNFDDTFWLGGKEYFISVQACNASDERSDEVYSGRFTCNNDVLEITNIHWGTTESDCCVLYWDKVPTATKYTVSIKGPSGSGSSGGTVTTNQYDAHSFVISKGNGDYTATVEAYRGQTGSILIDKKTTTPHSITIPTLATPVVAVDLSSYEITWDTIEHASSYTVELYSYFETNGYVYGYEWFKGEKNGITGTSCSLSEFSSYLENGKNYFVRVSAKDITGSYATSEGRSDYFTYSHTHTEVIDEAAAPTCTETGLTEGKHCSVCGEMLEAQETVAALGHTEVVDEAVAPTCTETGLTEGKHCSVCDAVLVAQETVDAPGHTEVVDEAVAPTCTETGLTEGKHCSVCGEILEAQETVEALGHTEVVDEAVAPTCTETGLTEGKHCSVCDAVLVAQEVVDALGHTEVVDEAVAPTCTETGLTEGKHCSVCDAVLVVQETVAALGHRFGEWTVTKEATETTEGSKEHICSVCKAKETATIPVLGHTHVFTTKASSQKATDATCEKATTYYVQCDGCNEVDTTKTVAVGDALGHDYGDWKKLNSTQHQHVCANDTTHVEEANHNFSGNKCVDCGYTKSSGGSSSGGGGGTYAGPTTSTTTTAAKPALTMELQIGNKNYIVNDKTYTYDAAPFIVGDRTMVPVRVVMETLGAKVDWNEAARSVTITLGDKVMTMTIGKEIPGYGSAPIIRDSRTYVPIRYIMENAGAKVDWNATIGEIVITK